MKRGEIWTASGGPDYAGKPRPVVVIQDDNFADTPSVTICPLTTHRIDAALVRPNVEPGPENGLRETSWAMTDKVTTMARSRLGKRIGALSAVEMVPIARALIVFLGLAGQSRN
ncbi:MAG TPA: type II toxin-antitoxin system PemK/MazF family toxin [Allosphingosinicella sp.]